MRELGSAVVSWDKSKILARTPKVMCKTKWDLKPQVMSSVHGSNSADVIHHDLITVSSMANRLKAIDYSLSKKIGLNKLPNRDD